MTTRGKCRVIFLVLFLSGLGFAVSGADEAQEPAQSVERHSVYVISKSEINTLLAGEKEGVWRAVDSTIVENIRRGLIARNVTVTVLESNDDLAKRSFEKGSFIILTKLEKVNLGFKGPFGRITTVRLSYILQNHEGGRVASQYYEETSHRNWKNCAKKIGELIVEDVAGVLANPPKAAKPGETDEGGAIKSEEEKSVDARLRQLEDLKKQGLITPEEYRKQRQKIIEGL